METYLQAENVIEALRGVYETMPAINVIEAALNSPNVDTHLLGSLLNTGAIEKADENYGLYAQGLTPSVIKCIEAFHSERAALFKALGYEDRAKPESIKKAARPDEHPELDLLIKAYVIPHFSRIALTKRSRSSRSFLAIWKTNFKSMLPYS